jgi:hypothetical protein
MVRIAMTTIDYGNNPHRLSGQPTMLSVSWPAWHLQDANVYRSKGHCGSKRLLTPSRRRHSA